MGGCVEYPSIARPREIDEINHLILGIVRYIFELMPSFNHKSQTGIYNFSKSVLEKLYLEDELSSRKIAKIFNCAYSTVDRYIHKYDFPIRNLSVAHITTFRAPFSGNLADKAYLIGLRIGDLRARKFYKNSTTILVDCASTRLDMVEHVVKLFKPYGRIWIGKPTKLNKVQVECSLNESFSFLLPKHTAFPNWTICNKHLFLSILAGFIDAEGSFFISASGQTFFSLGNYNTVILKQISRLLRELEIHHRLFLGTKVGHVSTEGYIQNGDYWTLQINRKYDLYCFAKIIFPYLRYSRKIADVGKVFFNIEARNLRYGFVKWPTTIMSV